MLMDPLPPINKVFALVTQQEKQFSIEKESNTRVLMNITNTGSADTRKYNNPNPTYVPAYESHDRNVCSFCGKLGHTIDISYKKHGFPPNFKFNNPNYASRNAILAMV